MNQISKKKFVLESQLSSVKICKYMAIYFLLIMTILTLPSCSVNTYGQTPKSSDNDVIKMRVYTSSAGGMNQHYVKFKKLIDKELSVNNYVDYIVLTQCGIDYQIKLFKTIQDKYVFLGNIQNNTYLDSVKNDTKCRYSRIAEQVYLIKSNNIIFENITNSKVFVSKFILGLNLNLTFVKGEGKYFLAMEYLWSKINYGNKHIVNINLSNGTKIQLSPLPNYTYKIEQNSVVILVVNPSALTSYDLDNHMPLVSPTAIESSSKMSDFLYPISIAQVQEMSNYEITSISISVDAKEVINTDDIESGSFIKNEAKYILEN